jgi:hypothetical protein
MNGSRRADEPPQVNRIQVPDFNGEAVTTVDGFTYQTAAVGSDQAGSSRQLFHQPPRIDIYASPSMRF